ncbi:ser/thr phosphatase family protein (macronuclear) [Tetrahymena thermophila SB210]|uniref:Sphingomyelin phosphodiesterase n=1 Tax=Tetrahymena thermophila (strain SB210) TaxID=312017 RepID=I7M8U9_TETTS|nr:ser/thr phosphatase family protein [Tetrahymena thermophila SB210]EAR99710.1 ser/thr phosphatase family protein [Tetrahymena thermophila SB210]|eukprot:XP_001019955.1 ser/thr phosphatase family protein [Tetrahymena thermophila SB210]
MKFLYFFLLVITIITQVSCRNDDDSELVKYVFTTFFQRNIDQFENPVLTQMAKTFLKNEVLGNKNSTITEQVMKLQQNVQGEGFSTNLCQQCQSFYNSILSLNLTKYGQELTHIIQFGCSILKIETPWICFSAVGEMAPSVLQGFAKRYLNPLYVCPSLGLCPPYYHNLNITAIAQNIIKDTPQVNRPAPTLKKTFKFLHMSDLHFDGLYLEGANGQCTVPDCCRFTSGKPKDESAKAGYWGYLGNCDIPFRTIEAAIRYIKNNLADEIDFIIWTGDNTNHYIWEQSFESNTDQTIRITNLLKKELPHIKVFPITGNHESFPVNVYDYFGDRENQQNDIFATSWEQWIGKEAADEYRQNGFYSSLITKYSQPLRIIAINTQAGNNENWYLIQNPTDPKGQLKWLKNQLQQAELNNEKVFIIGHIPSIFTLQEWAQIYTALIQRYSNIIISQFYGHTHNEQISVFRNQATDQINNVMFITGSLTSYGGHNPSFKMFEADFDSLQLINYAQYAMNLTYYNENKIRDINRVIFEKTYDFNSYYGYDDMSNFENIQDFLEKLKTDLNTQNKYHLVQNALANPTNLTQVTLGYYCDTFTTPATQSMCYGKPYKKDMIAEIFGTWYSHNPDDLLFE